MTKTGGSATDGAVQFVAVVGRLRQNFYLVVKGNDHHAVFFLQLIHEGNRRVLHIFEPKAGRAAGVHHESNCEWLVNGCEVSDSLFKSFLEDVEIFAAEIGDVRAVAIHDADRNGDERCVNPDHIALDRFALRECAFFTGRAIGHCAGESLIPAVDAIVARAFVASAAP